MSLWPFSRFLWPSSSCVRESGVLGRRGFAIESAASRVCREGGARVAPNVLLRDLDLAVPVAGGGRRLEIIADGLPLFGGVQLALMPPSFLRCTATERPVLVPPVWMVHRWQSHADGKNALILSLWAAKPEHGWVCWLWRSAVDGPRRRAHSCDSLQKPKRDQSQVS